jgi:hypothetical protein
MTRNDACGGEDVIVTGYRVSDTMDAQPCRLTSPATRKGSKRIIGSIDGFVLLRAGNPCRPVDYI